MGALIAFAVAAAFTVGVGLLYVVATYNGLVHGRNRAEEGWSGIDVQLERRADVVANRVETVKGYTTFDRRGRDRGTKISRRAHTRMKFADAATSLTDGRPRDATDAPKSRRAPCRKATRQVVR